VDTLRFKWIFFFLTSKHRQLMSNLTNWRLGDSTLCTLHLEPKIGIWNSCQTFIQPIKLLKLVHWITLVTPYIFSRKKNLLTRRLSSELKKFCCGHYSKKQPHYSSAFPKIEFPVNWLEKDIKCKLSTFNDEFSKCYEKIQLGIHSLLERRTNRANISWSRMTCESSWCANKGQGPKVVDH